MRARRRFPETVRSPEIDRLLGEVPETFGRSMTPEEWDLVREADDDLIAMIRRVLDVESGPWRD